MNIEDFLKNSILIFALTMDSFMVSFSYGASRIKISFSVVAGMNLVMSGMLGMAVWIGNGFSHFIEGRTTDVLELDRELELPQHEKLKERLNAYMKYDLENLGL